MKKRYHYMKKGTAGIAAVLLAALTTLGACTNELDDATDGALREGDVVITGLNISVATTDDTDGTGATRNTDNQGGDKVTSGQGDKAATRATDTYAPDGYGIYDSDDYTVSALPATTDIVRFADGTLPVDSKVSVIIRTLDSSRYIFKGTAVSNGDGTTWTLYKGSGSSASPVSGGIVISKADLAEGVSIDVGNEDERYYCYKTVEDGTMQVFNDEVYAQAILNASGIDGKDGYGSIIAAKNDNGVTLNVEMIHRFSLVTVSIDNQTGDPAKESDIESIQLISSGNADDSRPLHHYVVSGSTDEWQTFISTNDNAANGKVTYSNLVLAYTDGTTKTIAIPAASATLQVNATKNDETGTGSQTLHYAYTLTLKAGVPDEVTLRTDDTLPGWTEGSVSRGVIRIYNATQLSLIGSSDDYPLNGKYVLMNDIDMAAAKTAADAEEGSTTTGGWDADGNGEADAWKPIGKYKTDGDGYELTGFAFKGHFNGNGHVIRNLNITTHGIVAYYSYAGLFAEIGSEGIVHNLHLADADINITSSVSNNYTGGIAGDNHGRIDLCSVTGGSISGKANGTPYAGGIVGYNQNSSACISRCHVDGTSINATGSEYYVYAGGIVGENYNGSVVACYTLGGIVTADEGSGSSAKTYAGGIVGENSSGTIYGSYVKGANVYAKANNDTNKYPGTLVGYDSSGSITSCYSTLGTGTAPTGFADTDKASGSIGNDSSGTYNCNVGVGGTSSGFTEAISDAAYTGDGTANTAGYKRLTDAAALEDIAPITANNDGSLTVGDTSTDWTATGIWGGSAWTNATVAPVIDLTYNGEPGSK